ncbi:flagellar basal body-associated FliL family protein [Hydrogenophaga sp. OTU3427]|uniref:flagellar basal body-associated FliL family protein n=1 Tax=Hydrogenophaga sp. OTU3427 TaxID=3043856 RepID=UPI00313F3CB8
MATKAPAAEGEAAPKKGKKMLIIILAVVILLVVAGGGAAFFLMKKKGGEEEGGEAAPAKAHVDLKSPPTFLPLENMVINLADPGGNRFAQVGITLQVDNVKTGDAVKAFMPSIRNGILLLLSQRTTEELLQVQGKEQLANDIIAEVSRQLGYEGKKPSPIQAVLFSSFIVQ